MSVHCHFVGVNLLGEPIEIAVPCQRCTVSDKKKEGDMNADGKHGHHGTLDTVCATVRQRILASAQHAGSSAPSPAAELSHPKWDSSQKNSVGEDHL